MILQKKYFAIFLPKLLQNTPIWLNIDIKSEKIHFPLKLNMLDFTENTENFEQSTYYYLKMYLEFFNETWLIYCCHHLLDPPKAIVLKT